MSEEYELNIRRKQIADKLEKRLETLILGAELPAAAVANLKHLLDCADCGAEVSAASHKGRVSLPRVREDLTYAGDYLLPYVTSGQETPLHKAATVGYEAITQALEYLNKK